MQLSGNDLNILHPSVRKWAEAALSHYSNLEEAWKAGSASLTRTQLRFAGKDDLDDTDDGYYYCKIAKGAENETLHPSLPAIFAAQLLQKGKCMLRAVEDPQRENHYRIIVSEASAQALAELIPGMTLQGRYVEAGRSENPRGL